MGSIEVRSSTFRSFPCPDGWRKFFRSPLSELATVPQAKHSRRGNIPPQIPPFFLQIYMCCLSCSLSIPHKKRTLMPLSFGYNKNSNSNSYFIEAKLQTTDATKYRIKNSMSANICCFPVQIFFRHRLLHKTS